MATKRYYWLMLNEGFFNRNEVRYLEKQEGGHTLLLLYIKLMLLGINAEGELYFKGDKPFNITTLSMVTDMDRETVEEAIKTYLDLEMMEITEGGVYKLCDYEDLVGSETTDARRKRESRRAERTNNGNCPPDEGHCPSDGGKCHIDIEKDIDIDKDKDKDKDKEIDIDKEREGENIYIDNAPGRCTHTEAETDLMPSLEEVKEYNRLRGDKVDAEKFYDHYLAVGWMMGKSPIRNWQAAFRKWEKNELSDAFNPPSRDNAQSEGGGSFDTDDFFEAALRRSYKDLPKN